MKGSIIEFLKNQEHMCAKLVGLLVAVSILYIEFRGELMILPKEAETAECQRLRDHLDSMTIDRYKHARHMAYDAIQCIGSLPEETMKPLIYELIIPRLERDGIITSSYPDWGAPSENAQK